MDSRDGLDKTPDSIDMTESPVKHTNTPRHTEKINKDTSDNDTDETIIFDECHDLEKFQGTKFFLLTLTKYINYF